MHPKKHHFLGNGYIPVSSLREILQELDPKLTSNEIDGIIDEIDKDGSGTVDFDWASTKVQYIVLTI